MYIRELALYTQLKHLPCKESSSMLWYEFITSIVICPTSIRPVAPKSKIQSLLSPHVLFIPVILANGSSIISKTGVNDMSLYVSYDSPLM